MEVIRRAYGLDRPLAVQFLDWVGRAVIRPLADPVSPVGGLVALTGSLAPDGAIFKRAAATPALFESEGRAVVFTGLEDLARRIADPAAVEQGNQQAEPGCGASARPAKAAGTGPGGGLRMVLP